MLKSTFLSVLLVLLAFGIGHGAVFKVQVDPSIEEALSTPVTAGAITPKATDTTLGVFEVGSLVPDLNMMIKGSTGNQNLYLFDPQDSVSPDGFIVLHGTQGKFIMLLNGVTWFFYQNDANTFRVIRRTP